MGEQLRKILLEEEMETDEKTDDEKKAGDKSEKERKMLKKLHALDDQIEDFIDGLTDEIMSTEDNPVYIKKATQLLADMSKEYSEFIVALRSIVNAVDRKTQILPAFDRQESRVRDVLDGQGGGDGEMEADPPLEEPPAEDEEAEDEFVIAKKDKKSSVKEALER